MARGDWEQIVKNEVELRGTFQLLIICSLRPTLYINVLQAPASNTLRRAVMSKPEILARFELEDDGKPSYVKGDSLKHYAIELFLKDIPEDVSSVTYKLDPTYHEPVRKVPSAVPEFAESLT